MSRSWSSLFLTILGLTATIVALQVTPGSSCAALCIDGPEGSGLDPAASSTNTSDIVCKDVDYYSTEAGIKFKTCLECLQKSEKVNGTESDISWFLHNIRYAVDTCLFGFPEPSPSQAVNSPCLINYACLPLKNALLAGNLDPVNRDDFGYCTAANNIFHGPNLNSCIQCLQASTNQIYISNFIIALEGGCKRKPAPGELLGITGSMFSQFPVNVTGAPANLTDSNPNNSSSSTTMTVGTIVGIAVGGALLVMGAVALFIVYYRRKKAFKMDMQRQAEDDPSCGGSSITAIGGYQPWMYDHKKSGSFSSYEMKAHQGYKSNADFYDDMEDDLRSRHYNFDPHKAEHSAGSALPTHPAYIPRAMSRISARHPSPTPSIPASSQRTSKPDPYTSQTYRNTPEEVPGMAKIIPPPPARMPQQTAVAEPPATTAIQTAAKSYPTLQNIPPPPPRAPKIPSLHLPTVPRIRIPKKYTPPKIVVEEATPVAERKDSRRFRVTAPLAFQDNEQRFKDQTLRGGPVLATEAPDWGDREVNEIPIGSGKSTLYGY